jgi:hypothetical protein
MKTLQLKIKIKTLQAEARIIRQEEQKLKARSDEEKAYRRAARLFAKGKLRKEPVLKGALQKEETKRRKRRLRMDIRDHRKGDVREEARISHLAYGFMKGIPYKAMEQKCREEPDWGRVMSCVERFGGDPYGLKTWRGEKPDLEPAPKPELAEMRAS